MTSISCYMTAQILPSKLYIMELYRDQRIESMSYFDFLDHEIPPEAKKRIAYNVDKIDLLIDAEN